ncbi:MAG: (p)ppGpp synthetase [Magnetococcales bacterium]|nr:(p)ppGpp synthetase [Magnetococcales bacterium]
MSKQKDYHHLSQETFHDYYQENAADLNQAGASMRDLLLHIFEELTSLKLVSILYRVKDEEECLRKFNRKYRINLLETPSVYAIQEYLTDLVGVRIICHYTSEIPLIRAVLEREFHVLRTTDKAAHLEGTDSGFGYVGLHLDLKLQPPWLDHPIRKPAKNLPIEVQIRTVVQDAWSVLDHRIKYKKSIPQGLERRINALAALFEIADREFESVRDLSQNLEQKAANWVKHSSKEILDVFTFQKISTEFFRGTPPSPKSSDRFVHEILQYCPTLTGKSLQKILGQQMKTVKKYEKVNQKKGGRPFGSSAKIRYALYLSDPETYHGLLWEYKAEKIKLWLAKNAGDKQ